jgi:hypothetical protein
MNTDPRDLFISLNPLGLDERELKKDSSGFADERTHSDYLVFLAGYKAGAVDAEKSGCRRQRPINAEGYKPEISPLIFDVHCTDAAHCCSLGKAEGDTPDNNIPPEQLRADMATAKADHDANAQNAIDLRNQLDERDGLLRDCFTAMLKRGYSKPLRERIKDALSASAKREARHD